MNARSRKLMVHVLFLLLLTDLALSETNTRTPARILAKQTGAAQFEEHVEQPLNYDCNEHHHRLRKRSSDEDLDYEVYQGVVGRPGIDFPIFPRIPQTTFSCRSYGNGYFADLETSCQVFHICEEGRKISFLCPNGTVFQQNELTCDWWFKVNCAGSPSYYLESSEILNKARRQRVKARGQRKGYKTPNRLAENIPTGKPYKGSDRRIDSNENPSVESLDFEDISENRSNGRINGRTNGRSNGKLNDKLNDKPNGRSNDRSNGRSSDRSRDRSNDGLNDGLNSGENSRSSSRSKDRLSAGSNAGSIGRSKDRSNGVSGDRTKDRGNAGLNDESNVRSNDGRIENLNARSNGRSSDRSNGVSGDRTKDRVNAGLNDESNDRSNDGRTENLNDGSNERSSDRSKDRLNNGLSAGSNGRSKEGLNDGLNAGSTDRSNDRLYGISGYSSKDKLNDGSDGRSNDNLNDGLNDGANGRLHAGSNDNSNGKSSERSNESLNDEIYYGSNGRSYDRLNDSSNGKSNDRINYGSNSRLNDSSNDRSSDRFKDRLNDELYDESNGRSNDGLYPGSDNRSNLNGGLNSGLAGKSNYRSNDRFNGDLNVGLNAGSNDSSNDRSNERQNHESNDGLYDGSTGRSNNISNDSSSSKSSDRLNSGSNGGLNDGSSNILNDKSNDRSKDKLNDGLNVESSDGSKAKPNDISNGRSKDPNEELGSASIIDKLKLKKEKLLTDPDDHNLQHNDHELQITAESSSFVKDSRKNSYTDADKTLNKETEFISAKPLDRGNDAQASQVQRSNQPNDLSDKQKSGKKIDHNKPNGFYITSRPDYIHASTAGKGSYYTTAQPESYTSRNSLDGISVGDKQFVTPDNEDRSFAASTYSPVKSEFIGNGPLLKSSTTPSSYPGTYSTARRIDSTRTTPFYTPTIPTVAKAKPTDSKRIYVNVLRADEPTTVRGAITTENQTPRPVIIGMRRDSSEVHRFPIFSNGDLNVQLPVNSVDPPKTADFSLISSTAGPTYLPKGIKGNKNANIDDSVSRNVNGILQTVGVLKETMKVDLDDKHVSPRIGLDIPPSSGPGTLVSLTNYFANDEEATSTVGTEEEKPTTPTVDITAGLLSNKTSGKYLSLFGLNQNDTNVDHVATATTAIPKIEHVPTVVGDFTRTTIIHLAQNPETRKIAQVFSNAINKYIENPETFRKDLIDIRPTEPSVKTGSVTEALSTTPSSYFDQGGTVPVSILTDATTSIIVDEETSQSYLAPTTTKDDTTTNPTTESNDIAKEINNQFDVSTPVYDSVSTESTEATTYRGSGFSTSKPFTDISISSELLPPTHDEENEHESLHKVQSQSFVKSLNDLAKAPKSIAFDKNKNTFDTSAEKVTERPRTQSVTAQTEGVSGFDSTTDSVPTTVTYQNLKNTENKNGDDSSIGKETTTTRSQDQTTSTDRGQNKFDTATTTTKPDDQPQLTDQLRNKFSIAAPTTRTEDQTILTDRGNNKFDNSPGQLTTTVKSPTEEPTIHSIKTAVKTDFDSLTERIPTTVTSWLQNQKPQVKPTENPWSQITQSIYLHPLTINDGLMRTQKPTTLSPFDFVNTDRSRFEDASQDEEGIDDILNSPELSSELLPRNTGLQRIANKLFGGLNETEAEHLQNVMKKAEHNQNVLRLLLLLIQTCDDQNGKALERSRKILLNALIGMDGKLKSKHTNQVPATTTNKIPVTTYHRIFSDSTTTVKSPTTTESPSSSEETTKFEIRVPDTEYDEDNTVNTSTDKSVSSEQQPTVSNNPSRTSDERALELLKSLYSLASKFSRR